MIRIKSVKYLEDFTVELLLTNGKRKTVNLEPFLHGPIFNPLRTDITLFKTIHVDKDLGTVVWNNGADIDPDVLIHDRKPIRFKTKQIHFEASESTVKYKTRRKRFKRS